MAIGASQPQRKRSSYFSIVSVVLLLLTLLGFSDNLFTNVGQKSNHDAKFIVHGLFCLAWMMTIAVQANMVRRGDIRRHRRFGMLGFAIAIGVTLSTLYLFLALGKGWHAMPVKARVNRLVLPGYAIMVLLAYVHRNRPDRHKRLILLASFYMMEPVLSRAFDPFTPLMKGIAESDIDRAWWIFFALVLNGLFVSLAAYDWATLRRIHPVTAVGYACFVLAWTIGWLI